MFSRRHPFLYFSLIICCCSTLVALGFMAMLTYTSKQVSKQFMLESSKGKGNIGIVEITGMILSSKKIIEDIKMFRDDPAIKVIVLRIDSPGGGIGPSQEIYREIEKTKTKKKVITSMGSVAASGGYYIASATNGIMANPGTLTGSIGVIMEYANIMEIAEKIGISPVVIKSGEFKDMGSPLRQLKPTEEKILQELVDELHQQFVNDAAKAREMPVATMASLADGRVYTGKSALALKLVDRLGNLDDAIEWAGEVGQVDKPLKPVYPKEDKMSFIRRITETLLKDLNLSSAVSNNLRYIIN